LMRLQTRRIFDGGDVAIYPFILYSTVLPDGED
jgi:hypothetical protein